MWRALVWCDLIWLSGGTAAPCVEATNQDIEQIDKGVDRCQGHHEDGLYWAIKKAVNAGNIKKAANVKAIKEVVNAKAIMEARETERMTICILSLSIIWLRSSL